MFKSKRYILLILFFFFVLLSQSTIHADGKYASKIEFINGDRIELDVSLGQNQEKPIHITIMNNGSEEWDKSRIKLAYHLLDEQGNMILNDGARTTLTENVRADQTIELIPLISIPTDKELLDRNLIIQFDLVEEGVHWFSELDKENSISIPIVFNKKNDFKIIDKKDSISVFLKKSQKVDLKIRNTGTSIWDTKEGYKLSYHLLDKNYNSIIVDGVRSELPTLVKPGEEVTISASIDLPDNNGAFYIEWSMLQEGVAWFVLGDDNYSNLSSLHIYNSFWLYFIVIIAALLIGTSVYLIRDYVRFKQIDFLKSVVNAALFYVHRIDILWLLLSLVYKIKWSTLEVTQNVSSNYYIYVYSGIILCGFVLNCITKQKVRLYTVLFLNLSVSFILLSDIVYYTYFHDVITTGTLMNINQISGVSDSIIDLINPSHIYILFSDLLLFIPIYILFKLIKTQTLYRKVNVFVSMVGIAITLFYLGSNFYGLMKDDSFKKSYQNVLTVRNLGLINFHIYDTTKYLSQKFSIISPQELEEIKEWKDSEERNLNDEYFGIAKQKNVILIQSEALQSFVINLKVQNEEVTPNLNNFIKDSMYFENFYDQTNQGRTSDAEFIALNSLFPLSSGSVYTTYANNDFDSLPKILNVSGYSTLSSHGYKGSFWNRIQMHPRLGFQQSYFEEELVLDEQIGMGLSDRTFFIQSIEKIKELKEPYFSFLISLSNHHPYNTEVPIPMNLGDLEGTLIGRYINNVHYADYAFGQLLDELREDQMLENTVIALYGDHDAGIGLDEISRVYPIEDTTHLEILYDKVPFVIHVPGIEGSIVHKNSGHLDITPTLLNLLGIEHSDNVFMGKSIFSTNAPVIFRNGNYVAEDYISEDGVCYSKDSLQECKDFRSSANEKMSISDKILRYNLVPKLLENQEDQ